jgi:hypothetical protein
LDRILRPPLFSAVLDGPVDGPIDFPPLIETG